MRYFRITLLLLAKHEWSGLMQHLDLSPRVDISSVEFVRTDIEVRLGPQKVQQVLHRALSLVINCLRRG